MTDVRCLPVFPFHSPTPCHSSALPWKPPQAFQFDYFTRVTVSRSIGINNLGNLHLLGSLVGLMVAIPLGWLSDRGGSKASSLTSVDTSLLTAAGSGSRSSVPALVLATSTAGPDSERATDQARVRQVPTGRRPIMIIGCLAYQLQLVSAGERAGRVE